jgi:hypothetical protein
MIDCLLLHYKHRCRRPHRRSHGRWAPTTTLQRESPPAARLYRRCCHTWQDFLDRLRIEDHCHGRLSLLTSELQNALLTRPNTSFELPFRPPWAAIAANLEMVGTRFIVLCVLLFVIFVPLY